MPVRGSRPGDEGGVLVIVALVLPVLMLLAGVGVASFGVTASHRELQRAADQAAVAGAAALPPADPNVLVENSPFPLPNTNRIYNLLPSPVDDAIPRIGELVPDPRAVSCAVASEGNLGASASPLVGAFEDASNISAPLHPDGTAQSTVCDDPRVYPVIEQDPNGQTALECTNTLVRYMAAEIGPFDPSVSVYLDPVLHPIQGLVDSVLRMPLNHVLPAALTPRMRVDTTTWVRPPMWPLMSWLPSGSADADGLTLRASAVALRRIKNAVVVPILPAHQLLIETGLVREIDVMTDPVNLNRALATNQSTLVNAVDDADRRLDTLMGGYGLPCHSLLYNLKRDLRDIYSPPTGPAPTAYEIVDAAVEAQAQASARLGVPQPSLQDPQSLAGEAFLLIGVSVDDAMQPVAATQIPILDAGLVVMHEATEGDYRASVISAANAHGAFRASLVE